jgi:hypothetical protein
MTLSAAEFEVLAHRITATKPVCVMDGLRAAVGKVQD